MNDEPGRGARSGRAPRRAGSGSAPRRSRSGADLSDAEYERLLEWRTGLRRFLDWSARQAADAGVSPAQHQLLLAIRGLGEPTIGEVAEVLLLRHHSAVGLVTRAEEAALLIRRPDLQDARVVRLALTAKGRRTLRHLSALHRDELARLRPRLAPLWEGLGEGADGS